MPKSSTVLPSANLSLSAIRNEFDQTGAFTISSLRGVQYDLPNITSSISASNLQGKYKCAVSNLLTTPSTLIDCFSPTNSFSNVINLPTFDTTNRYITFPGTSSLYLDCSNISVTPDNTTGTVFLAKFTLSSVASNMCIFDYFTNPASAVNELKLSLNATNKLEFNIYNSNGSNITSLRSLSSVVTGCNYTMAYRIVNTTGGQTLWLNSVSQGTGTLSLGAFANRTGTLRMGLDRTNAIDSRFKGKLQSICFFNANMSAASISNMSA